MDRQLIDYLPQVLKEVREYKAIMEAEQPEISDLWDELDSALNEQFLSTMTEYGVSKWEDILNIVPQATRTLEERKFLVLVRLSEGVPYTVRSLAQKLASLCGEDNYTIELNAATYSLTVEIALVARNSFDDAESLVYRMSPANLVITVTLKYNRYETLDDYTHTDLASYTHDYLRNEVLS